MNHVRKMLSALGGIFLAALLILALAPKATRGIAAALVQIAPGSATHLGQNESQLVSLQCSDFKPCVSIDPTGVLASTPYVVPSGYTLIVTDYQWYLRNPQLPNILTSDSLFNSSAVLGLTTSVARTDANGFASAHEHYEAGIRVGSGVTIADAFVAIGLGSAFVQGYLVPN